MHDVYGFLERKLLLMKMMKMMRRKADLSERAVYFIQLLSRLLLPFCPSSYIVRVVLPMDPSPMPKVQDSAKVRLLPAIREGFMRRNPLIPLGICLFTQFCQLAWTIARIRSLVWTKQLVLERCVVLSAGFVESSQLTIG